MIFVHLWGEPNRRYVHPLKLEVDEPTGHSDQTEFEEVSYMTAKECLCYGLINGVMALELAVKMAKASSQATVQSSEVYMYVCMYVCNKDKKIDAAKHHTSTEVLVFCK